MTSKLTRERLEELAAGQSGFNLRIATHEESQELARMALAAMGSEPVAYMYDGEDGREYNGHNEFSGGGKGIPLYRHAQQPVVPDERAAFNAWNNDIDCPLAGRDAKSAAWLAWNYRAMLQAQSDDDGEPTDDERIMAIEGIHNCERCGGEGWVVGEMGITRCACGQAGNSPVIPDRWIPVSERMPENNGVYFGWDGKRVLEVNCFFGGFSANQFIHGEITHWMPLPAAPQEVKGE